jgi:predicted DNA-binding transcriptional regulator AlpA
VSLITFVGDGVPVCPNKYPCGLIEAERACAFRKLGYSAEEAAEYVGIGEATVHELGKPGSRLYDSDFPSKVQLTPRRVVYLRPDLDEWVAKKKAATLSRDEADHRLAGAAKTSRERRSNATTRETERD